MTPAVPGEKGARDPREYPKDNGIGGVPKRSLDPHLLDLFNAGDIIKPAAPHNSQFNGRPLSRGVFHGVEDNISVLLPGGF
jgi:hypothetical protein